MKLSIVSIAARVEAYRPAEGNLVLVPVRDGSITYEISVTEIKNLKEVCGKKGVVSLVDKSVVIDRGVLRINS